MRHLTMTGFYAGTPLCGVDKARALESGDTFAHAAYCDETAPGTCVACRNIWDAAGHDDDCACKYCADAA